MPEIKDKTGERFGYLTVIRMAGRNSSNKVIWECRCDCGNIAKVQTAHLNSGHTKSCGCYSKKRAKESNTTHGMKNTRLYNIWCDIKKRCYNPKFWAFDRYGGRGIVMCDEWIHNFEPFRDWAVSNGYRDDLTLDRKNNDGNYEPSNCRWVTRKEQMNNTSKSHIVTVEGESKTISQWADYLNVKRSMIDSAHKRGKNLAEYIKSIMRR